MNQYKIVCLKEKTYDLAKNYPDVIEFLYMKQNDVYETKQVETLFDPMTLGKEKLLQSIQQREDYTYYHGKHHLFNPITDEKITIVMNEYDIDVLESDEKHAVFDMIKAFSKNFYMIKA